MGRSFTTLRGPLPRPAVRADESTLTRFAGALPFIRYCSEVLELPAMLEDVAPVPKRRRRHAAHRVLFAFLIAAAIGTDRLAHLDWFDGDSLLLKMLRFARWPVRKVFSAALGNVEDRGVQALSRIVSALGRRSVAGAATAVLDFDSTVVVSFGEQEGAAFGYCGKGRNRRRHHPLVASIAASRAAVHARYRDGSGINDDEAIGFFEETLARTGLGFAGGNVSIRADAGFWSKKVCRWFVERGIPFACAHPLATAVKLRLWGATFRPLDDDEDIETAILAGPELGYADTVRIAVIRRRVHDPKSPPAGKRVTGLEAWRYQAVVSNLPGPAEALWRFYNGRGDAERVFKVGKQALSLGRLVSQSFRANEVAFLLRLIAMNADILFQQEAERAAEEDGRGVVHMGLKARQPRLYRLPGRLLREHGRWVLRVPGARRVAELFAFYAPDLISSA